MNHQDGARIKHHVSDIQEIKSIPICRIRILNPRSRGQKTFAAVVESISTLGLKRPITVAESGADEDGEKYDLICGQGRIEALRALGETQIPAIVVAATESERYLMGLVENLARRKQSNRDLLNAVRILSDRGYNYTQISQKTGLEQSYIHGILQLLSAGEDRLIAAVEKGWLPLTLAVEIARATEADVQIAMMEAYESGLLRGEQLLKVRRLVDRRKILGENYEKSRRHVARPITPARLAQTFQEEVQRQKIAVRRAELSNQRLLFIISALRGLLSDEYFRTLLSTEGISDVPKPLADRISRETMT